MRIPEWSTNVRNEFGFQYDTWRTSWRMRFVPGPMGNPAFSGMSMACESGDQANRIDEHADNVPVQSHVVD